MLMFQSVLGALTLLPLGWLAWRVAGKRAARIAVFLVAIYLPLTLFAGLLLSETLFVFLFACALVALVRAREELSAGWSRAAAVWLALAGLLLGMGVLTRATALAFMPLAVLWLALAGERRELRTRLAGAGVVLGICVLCLLPWIARNYAAYKRFVLVDTTSGYNLWLASVGVRDEPRLQADLVAIPNPADRQGYAYEQAWKNISADPLGFVGKGIKESLDLWRPLFGAEERQISGYALGRVPAWHLTALLIFDDMLYVVILVAAVAGLALSPPHPLKSLTGLSVGLWVVMSFAFFAVTRFRLPVVAVLIPWAGVGLDLVWARQSIVGRVRDAGWGSRLASAAALVGIALIVVPAISIGDTWLGIQRWGEQEPYRRAEALLQDHHIQEAIAAYTEANTALSDTRYGLAAAYLQANIPDRALEQLTANEPEDRVEPAIIRGEAARIVGNLDAARSFFNARTLQVQPMEAQRWAWDHLNPPMTSSVQIGSGLDLGYIRGFYGPEKDSSGQPFRWTSDKAEVRGLQPRAGYELAWSGWRPEGLARAGPTLTWLDKSGGPVGPAKSYPLENSTEWTTSRVDNADGAATSLSMEPAPFIGAGNDPRLLGVRVTSIGGQP